MRKEEIKKEREKLNRKIRDAENRLKVLGTLEKEIPLFDEKTLVSQLKVSEFLTMIEAILNKLFDERFAQLEMLLVGKLKTQNYSSADVRKILGGISHVTLWSYDRKGITKPVIVGRRKMYLKSDIDKLIAQKTLDADSPRRLAIPSSEN